MIKSVRVDLGKIDEVEVSGVGEKREVILWSEDLESVVYLVCHSNQRAKELANFLDPYIGGS